MSRRTQVNIRDVAAAAGVSVGTVSRALKNQPGLTEATRLHIRQIAVQMGYDLGRLRSEPIRRIAFVQRRMREALTAAPAFTPLLHGAEAACRAQGVALSFLTLVAGEPVAPAIDAHQPDALLCVGGFDKEVLVALADIGKPIVLVEHWMPGMSSVNPDYFGGAYRATRHLIETGRRRIALLAGSSSCYGDRQRARGYRLALFNAGILLDPAREVMPPEGMAGDTAVAAAMAELLRPLPRLDAVFAGNDVAALAVIRYCRAHGLRVPDDIAVVGFGDIAAAAEADPPLTTVRVDRETLGARAVDLLLGGRYPGEDTLVLPVDLIRRGSSVTSVRRPVVDWDDDALCAVPAAL